MSLVNEEHPSQPIPVIVNIFKNNSPNCSPPSWFDPPQKPYKNRKAVRVTLRRDNKLQQSGFLPKIAVSNLRSLMPKTRNFCHDMKERDIGLNLMSEIWEKPGKRKHIFKIEQMFLLEGLKYISTPRPLQKRGDWSMILEKNH